MPNPFDIFTDLINRIINPHAASKEFLKNPDHVNNNTASDEPAEEEDDVVIRD